MLIIFRHRFSLLVFLILLFQLSATAKGAPGEGVAAKRIEVAMRMIGHEFLNCLGDNASRVLPVEQAGDRYEISFESAFSFDPEDLISVIGAVMTETETAGHYLVEVEQCATHEVVYMSEMGNPGVLPCTGRRLPKDRYSLFITILDGVVPGSVVRTVAADGSPLGTSETDLSRSFISVLLLVPLLILIGFAGYVIGKRHPATTDPNLVRIGASQFNKRRMTLSYADKSVELSNKEAELLTLLHTAANEPVAREEILRTVWGDEGNYVGRTLDVFVSKLRKKLRGDTSVKIINIRGVGYKLVMELPD